MHIIDRRPFGHEAQGLHRSLYGDTENWSAPVAAQRRRTGRFRGVVRNIVARVNEYRRYRATITALSTMTDYQLADIGLHRGQLQYTARLWAMDASGVRSIADHGGKLAGNQRVMRGFDVASGLLLTGSAAVLAFALTVGT